MGRSRKGDQSKVKLDSELIYSAIAYYFSTMPDIHLLEIQNPYPDAVLLDLIAKVSNTPSPTDRRITLTTTLNFQEQWLTLTSKRVKFALKTGRLHLSCSQGHVTPAPHLPGCLAKLHTPQELSWQLLSPPGQTLLKPLSQSFELGSLDLPKDQSCQIVATITVDPIAVVITEVEGLWRPDLSPNKLSISERVLSYFLVKEVLPPALSWVQVGIGNVEGWQDLYPNYRRPRLDPTAPETPAETDLKATLEAIATAETDDLIQLATLVGLNPKLDLAGGKFVGTNLSGIELSQSYLPHSNFRGALLTDADLSDTDLSYATLSGADLSGAYLEGANLHASDCHKSSLALANLIGADLSQANVRGTAVHSANFTEAIVVDAQFEDNPGMTESLKASLLERGAKFPSDRS